MRSGLAHGRRFFRTTLQPIAEHMEYNPVTIAARYRSNYLGSVSLPAQQTASYASEPKREGGTPDELPGQAIDPNRVPPEGTPSGSSGASKGHSSPTREELEQGKESAGKDTGSSTAGPSGRPSDSHATSEDGVQRNARPGEFAPNDPKKPAENNPESTRGTGGQ